MEISERNPQHIFWKKSATDVPEKFEQDLLQAFGRDEVGDPVVRVRLDDKKFKEPIWIVEEKWSPAAFGTPEEWNKTKSMHDPQTGITHDFGDFPNRGIYAAMFVWADHEGRPLPLSQDLIERLKYQRYARETKNIAPEQVLAQTMADEMRIEQQQKERQKEAERAVAEDLKMRAEKIFTAETRTTFFPQTIKPKNILPLN